MLRIHLKPAAHGQPGYAELIVYDWQAGTVGVEVTVQRNQDGHYLGKGEKWGAIPAWHEMHGLQLAGSTLVGEVGPAFVDPLLLDPKMQYLMQIRCETLEEAGSVRIIGTILSSKAAGVSSRSEERIEHKAVGLGSTEANQFASSDSLDIEDAKVVSEIPKEDETAPSSDSKKRSPFGLIILILLLVALAAAAVWWLSLRTDPNNLEADTSPTETKACTVEALGETQDDLSFIQACMKTQPSTKQILDVISVAKEANRCEVMQRLYAYKAQSGDAEIAYHYAREYDPQTFVPNGCVEAADIETAIYWYELAVLNDSGHSEASQRLEELRN